MLFQLIAGLNPVFQDAFHSALQRRFIGASQAGGAKLFTYFQD
jgi:hypothetical protein